MKSEATISIVYPAGLRRRILVTRMANFSSPGSRLLKSLLRASILAVLGSQKGRNPFSRTQHHFPRHSSQFSRSVPSKYASLHLVHEI